jgi:hypothetical protein
MEFTMRAGKMTLLIWAIAFVGIGCDRSAPDGIQQQDSINNQSPIVADEENDNSVDGAETNSAAVNDPAKTSSSPALPPEVNTKNPAVYGRLEASMLRNGAIDTTVQKKLSAPNFDQFVTAFERENSNNGAAQQLTEAYQNEVGKTLAAVPGSAAMSRFTCGSNICMGYTRSEPDSNWFAQWYTGFAGASRTPVRAMTSANIPLPGGGTEHRIVFTTQGDAAFYGRPGPP